jgi:hypothetical protein
LRNFWRATRTYGGHRKFRGGENPREKSVFCPFEAPKFVRTDLKGVYGCRGGRDAPTLKISSIFPRYKFVVFDPKVRHKSPQCYSKGRNSNFQARLARPFDFAVKNVCWQTFSIFGPLNEEKIFGGQGPPQLKFPAGGSKKLKMGKPCYEFSKIEILNRHLFSSCQWTSDVKISDFLLERGPRNRGMKLGNFGKSVVPACTQQHCIAA